MTTKTKKQNHERFMLQTKLLLVLTVVAGVFVLPQCWPMKKGM